MAKNIHELAQEALDSGNYQLALELFEHILQFSNDKVSEKSDQYAPSDNSLISIDTYIGYGDSLARCGRSRESFNVYAFISNQLGYSMPVDKLKHLTIGLLECFASSKLLTVNQQHSSSSRQQQKQPSPVPALQNCSDECANTNNSNCSVNSVFLSNSNDRLSCDDSTDLKTNHHRSYRCSDSSDSSSSNCCSNECAVLYDNRCNSNINNNNTSNNKSNSNSGKNSATTANYVDPLLCPICEHVLLYPVTMVCGHTYCRECVYSETQCQVCDKRFSVDGDNLKQDVLISRLVEKWWMPHIEAELVNDKSQALLHQNSLDEALKQCNESLLKCPKNYRGLLLRSEVLYRLNHLQSSLADADNAIKSRPTSYHAHLNRALTLAALGSIDEAIVAHCLSIHFVRDLSNYTVGVRLELAKLIQKFLLPCKQSKSSSILSDDTYIIKEYINRCHLRALKHYPQLYDKKCVEPASFVYDENDCFDNINSSAGKDNGIFKKSRLSHKCRHLERENFYLPYKKSDKFLKTSKKFRRKHCSVGVDEKFHKIMYLNRLAGEMIANDSIVDVVSISNMDKRIAKLFDQVYYEISKTKQSRNVSVLEVQRPLIDASDFDCVLCYRTLWKPVVTPCGHTFCMVCLDRCLDYSTCCPLCKTTLVEDFSVTYSINSAPNSTSSGTKYDLASISSSKKSVTRFIEVAMQRFIPLAYRKRQLLEIEKEPSVPVFICTTAYPNVPCPLYVYEPRHRLMIRRAIESGQRQFGIVQPHANGGYSDFGTLLNIQDCVLLGNGCSILSTIGHKRFKVIERNEKDGYDIAKVEYICDEAISAERLKIVKMINETIYKKAIDWYNSLPSHIHAEIHKSFGSMPMLQKNLESISDGPSWAWYIIALLPLNQNLKVEILATTDLEKRLRAIDKTLEYVAAQQRRSVCVVSCEGLQACQAIDCCMRATSSNQLDGANSHAEAQVTDFLL